MEVLEEDRYQYEMEREEGDRERDARAVHAAQREREQSPYWEDTKEHGSEDSRPPASDEDDDEVLPEEGWEATRSHLYGELDEAQAFMDEHGDDPERARAD